MDLDDWLESLAADMGVCDRLLPTNRTCGKFPKMHVCCSREASIASIASDPTLVRNHEPPHEIRKIRHLMCRTNRKMLSEEVIVERDCLVRIPNAVLFLTHANYSR